MVAAASPAAQRRLLLGACALALCVQLLELGAALLRPDARALGGRVQDASALGRQLRPRYDFIVVGGASSSAAAAVLASRLSERARWSVLLLEPGGADGENSVEDEPLVAEPEDGFCLAMKDRRCRVPRPSGLKDTDSLAYVRGDPRDYDHWSALGNEGWSYNDVIRFFEKSEDVRIDRRKDSDSPSGYLSLEEPKWKDSLAEAVLSAGVEAGLPRGEDFRTEASASLARLPLTSRDGVRCDARRAFLRPARHRRNLDVSYRSRVEALELDPDTRRVTGVRIVRSGVRMRVGVGREVVLAAGALETPKLLMLAGVGPDDHLRRLGIQPVANLSVGKNLLDHIALGGLVVTLEKSPPMIFPRISDLGSIIRSMLFHSEGPTDPKGAGEPLGFFSTSQNDKPEYPDAALYVARAKISNGAGNFIRQTTGLEERIFDKIYETKGKESFALIASLMRPKSTGKVVLTSANPEIPPAIYLNYLSDDRDVRALVDAARQARRLAETSTMKNLGAQISSNLFRGCQNLTHDEETYLECALRHYTMSLWHYGGTCKMGPADDPNAVVDARLRVYGVENVRVADSSIMPTLVTGDLNAAVVMIAEKASDMIKEEWESECEI